jgi:hypothetical protein
MARVPRTPCGIAFCGFLVSSAVVATTSNPMKAKKPQARAPTPTATPKIVRSFAVRSFRSRVVDSSVSAIDCSTDFRSPQAHFRHNLLLAHVIRGSTRRHGIYGLSGLLRCRGLDEAVECAARGSHQVGPHRCRPIRSVTGLLALLQLTRFAPLRSGGNYMQAARWPAPQQVLAGRLQSRKPSARDAARWTIFCVTVHWKRRAPALVGRHAGA